MSLFTWDKGFELGISEFDEHHKHLLELLNDTYDNFTMGSSKEIIEVILDKLIDYATYHFVTEEKWMLLNGYDGLVQHREEHERFSRRIVEIQKDYHNGKSNLSIEVLTFLKNWFIEHILSTDAAYGRFVYLIKYKNLT